MAGFCPPCIHRKAAGLCSTRPQPAAIRGVTHSPIRPLSALKLRSCQRWCGRRGRLCRGDNNPANDSQDSILSEATENALANREALLGRLGHALLRMHAPTPRGGSHYLYAGFAGQSSEDLQAVSRAAPSKKHWEGSRRAASERAREIRTYIPAVQWRGVFPFAAKADLTMRVIPSPHLHHAIDLGLH